MTKNGIRSKLSRAYRTSPTFLLVGWFTLLILFGSFLLALPQAHRADGPAVSVLTALFTATSAACVTGLVVVDTPEAYSAFGQAVILLLMEMGGLGVMAFANLGFSVVGRRMSLSGQAALADTLFQNDAACEFRAVFKRIVILVVAVQIAGILLMAIFLLPRHLADGRGAAWTLWSAAFHSVSAFCNAGFSVYRGNLAGVAENTPFLAVTAMLVILGGLGHSVLVELWNMPRLLRAGVKKARWVSFNARVVLAVTAILLVGGSLSVWLCGDARGDTFGHAVFQSVSARTAGFNSVLLDRLPVATCLFLVILMFVGGSPGSCAGGVKTTSLAIWLARIRANTRNDPNVNLFGYTVAPDLVSKARLLMALSVLWNLFGVVFLSLLQPAARLDVILFEQVSAFATVGLSMGLTPELTGLSQLWIILSMFVGRLGPLTLILWVMPTPKCAVTRPIARLMVG